MLGEVDAAVGGFAVDESIQRGEEEAADDRGAVRQGVEEAGTDESMAVEEMGVAVARGDVIVEEEREDKVAVVKQRKKKARGDEFDDIFGALESKPPAKRAKKKKKAKGDEFDDIFGGL